VAHPKFFGIFTFSPMRVPHPSFFSNEGWVPTNLEHRTASTILSSGRRRGCLSSRLEAWETTTLSLPIAQDCALEAHNEDSETQERTRRMSGSCVSVSSIDLRDLPGPRLPRYHLINTPHPPYIYFQNLADNLHPSERPYLYVAFEEAPEPIGYSSTRKVGA
jgi:hypothetical protein